MKKTFVGVCALVIMCFWGIASADPCLYTWDSRDLKTGVEGPKKWYGDTNVAYAGFSIPPERYTVYRVKGKFPKARYMSIESSELRDIGSWDFDAIQDHEIIPDGGSRNPFLSDVNFNVEGRQFTLDIIPDEGPGSDWGSNENAADNILAYPTNGNDVDISLRVVLPDPVFTDEDLGEFTICMLDQENGECSQGCASVEKAETSAPGSVLDNFDALAFYTYQLFDFSELPSQISPADAEDVVLAIIKAVTPEKRWAFSFDVIQIPFEGNSAIPGYGYGLTQMDQGKVALIKFKTPSVADTSCGSEEGPFPICYPFAEPVKDLRYWSICSLDIERGKGLACLSDFGVQPDGDGYVTMVYGPAGGEVEEIAGRRGYGFFPDNRQELDVPDDLPAAFVFRQVLPSTTFSASGLHNGEYVPRCRVCSAESFIAGTCNIR